MKSFVIYLRVFKFHFKIQNTDIVYLQKLTPLTSHFIIVNSRAAPKMKNIGRNLYRPNIFLPGNFCIASAIASIISLRKRTAYYLNYLNYSNVKDRKTMIT